MENRCRLQHHRWSLQGNVSWQKRVAGHTRGAGPLFFHVLLIKISSAALDWNCRDALVQALSRFCESKLFQSEKSGSDFSSALRPSVSRAGWFWRTNSWHNAIQVHRFDHRIGEVDSINKNRSTGDQRRLPNRFCAYLRILHISAFRWEWFAGRFRDAIKFVFFWHRRLMLF